MAKEGTVKKFGKNRFGVATGKKFPAWKFVSKEQAEKLRKKK